MSLPISRLQQILASPARPFQTGDYIRNGFDFMNKQFGLMLGFTLINMGISFGLQMIPLVGGVLSVFVGAVLAIGYAQFIYSNIKHGKTDFGEFFSGFNKIMPLVSTYLLTVLISIVALLPALAAWYQAGVFDWIMEALADYPYMEDLPLITDTVNMPMFALGLLLMILGVLVITILFSWSLFIVWFYETTPVEALRISQKLITRNWGSFVLFVVISGLITVAGALLCCVGVLYALPAMSAAMFFSFADATQLLNEPTDSDGDIIDHFIA